MKQDNNSELLSTHAADVYAQHCPSRHVLARIGDKWSVMILSLLSQGELRFGVIKRSCEGISQKMLTQTLRHLEQGGLVMRKVLSEKPLQVSYALTLEGKGLELLLRPLVTWVHEYTQRHYASLIE